MKRILTSLLVASTMSILMSCDKTDPQVPDTTYTITANLTGPSSEYTIHHDLTIFEYNEEGEKVANNSMEKIVTETKKFTANAQAVKVKVYIKMYGDISTIGTKYYWVQQVFYLEEGKNNDIKVDGHSIVGSKEP